MFFIKARISLKSTKLSFEGIKIFKTQIIVSKTKSFLKFRSFHLKLKHIKSMKKVLKKYEKKYEF